MRTPTLLILIMLSVVSSQASVLKVGKNELYATIQEAIIHADSGDFILVEKGKYQSGNILIDKPIHLIGVGIPVLDGGNISDVITVTANHVFIQGFIIQNSGRSDIKEMSGVGINHCHDCTVQNCILIHNFFGIYAGNSNNCSITANEIWNQTKSESSGGNGIHLWHCDSMLLKNNFVKECRDGIYFEFVSNSTITGNVSTQQLRYGIHFMFSDHDLYSANTFYKNGSGVAVMYSNHVSMNRNKFLDNKGGAAYGILLKEITDSKIIGNQFVSNTIGLYMEGTSRCFISDNEFRSNGYGVKLFGDCDDDTLSLNNFFSNTMDVATNSSNSNHLFYNNYWDKYTGYDLNHDGTGDVVFRPVSLFSKLSEIVPNSVMLLHSFLIELLEKAESILPSLTPISFVDDKPSMKPNHR